jgi:hypothetical protein
VSFEEDFDRMSQVTSIRQKTEHEETEGTEAIQQNAAKDAKARQLNKRKRRKRSVIGEDWEQPIVS